MLLFLWVRIESYLGACLILSYLGACLILLKSSFGAMVSFQKDLTRGEATSELTHLVVTVVCYLVSHVQLLETPWPVATRILCPWDFSGKSTDVGLPFPTPGDLTNPGIKPVSPALAGGFFSTESPGLLAGSVPNEL